MQNIENIRNTSRISFSKKCADELKNDIQEQIVYSRLPVIWTSTGNKKCFFKVKIIKVISNRQAFRITHWITTTVFIKFQVVFFR